MVVWTSRAKISKISEKIDPGHRASALREPQLQVGFWGRCTLVVLDRWDMLLSEST